ncbi:MAG TPA: sigma-70 family RNA polymerase sigma factor [Thermoanaerobaculia bacterium]|nr:sigma-70 family RNA polymerase sigma factor [Thermoanaerobaculia bacterium]
MAIAEDTTVTDLLLNWNSDNKAALDRLMPLVAEELRRRAQRYLDQERPGHTLQPTALVNELYMRLLDRRQADWKSRAHFFAFAARVMRRILVDHARARGTAKRGGDALAVTLSAADEMASERTVDMIALDEALEKLARLDEEQARIVELRFFGGLSVEETAAVIGCAEATIARRWASARAWLFGQLGGSPA